MTWPCFSTANARDSDTKESVASEPSAGAACRRPGSDVPAESFVPESFVPESFGPASVDPALEAEQVGRLHQTVTFRDGRIERWREGVLGIVGAGLIGGRLAREAVLSGIGQVRIWDPDKTEPTNRTTQYGQVGVPKVDNVRADCDRIRLGHVLSFQTTIQHASIETLAQCDVLIDCSDDPRLVWTLTELSNGLGVPLLRAAVDGSGQMELGRVSSSGTLPDAACQLCSFSLDDLLKHRTRKACPGPWATQLAPTQAGGAIGGAIASIALLQAQRLVTGNDTLLVPNTEVLLDLTNMRLIHLKLERSVECLSGHRRWTLTRLNAPVEQTSVSELMAIIERDVGTPDLAISFYQHPLSLQAFCSCGATLDAPGTPWAEPPVCGACGTAMEWLQETELGSLSAARAAELNILHVGLDRLGIPAGAMVVVCMPNRPDRRFVLSGGESSSNPGVPRV